MDGTTDCGNQEDELMVLVHSFKNDASKRSALVLSTCRSTTRSMQILYSGLPQYVGEAFEALWS